MYKGRIIVGGGVIGCSIAPRSQSRLECRGHRARPRRLRSSRAAAGMLAAQSETSSVGPFLTCAAKPSCIASSRSPDESRDRCRIHDEGLSASHWKRRPEIDAMGLGQADAGSHRTLTHGATRDSSPPSNQSQEPSPPRRSSVENPLDGRARYRIRHAVFRIEGAEVQHWQRREAESSAWCRVGRSGRAQSWSLRSLVKQVAETARGECRSCSGSRSDDCR